MLKKNYLSPTSSCCRINKIHFKSKTGNFYFWNYCSKNIQWWHWWHLCREPIRRRRWPGGRGWKASSSASSWVFSAPSWWVSATVTHTTICIHGNSLPVCLSVCIHGNSLPVCVYPGYLHAVDPRNWSCCVCCPLQCGKPLRCGQVTSATWPALTWCNECVWHSFHTQTHSAGADVAERGQTGSNRLSRAFF